MLPTGDDGDKATTVGRPRIYETAAQKRAAYLERHNLCQLNVTVSREVGELLDAYMERQRRDGAALSKGQVIEKLLRKQLLRKR